MGRIAGCAAWKRLVVLALVALTGSGCATSFPVVPPDEIPTAPVDVTSTVVTPPPAEMRDRTDRVPIEDRAPVAVILDDPHYTYLELLQVFSAQLGRPYQVFNLAHRTPASVRTKLASLAPIQAIVVGSAALEVAGQVPGVEIFHAGVLDSAGTGPGVDALPPFDAQLDQWLAMAPRIERIGVIGSPAVRGRIDDLAEVCATRGVSLEQREVGSDKETLLAFRSMVPHIDGFVFLPDDRVLSPTVIQQMMGHGQRNEVQMLVYSPVMFNLGGSLFVQPDPVMVATTLIELLSNPTAEATVRSMRTLTRAPAQDVSQALVPIAPEADDD